MRTRLRCACLALALLGAAAQDSAPKKSVAVHLPLEQALEGDSWQAAGSITARGVFHKNRTGAVRLTNTAAELAALSGADRRAPCAAPAKEPRS